LFDTFQFLLQLLFTALLLFVIAYFYCSY